MASVCSEGILQSMVTIMKAHESSYDEVELAIPWSAALYPLECRYSQQQHR